MTLKNPLARYLAVLALLLVSFGLTNCGAPAGKDFTAADVQEIRTALEAINPTEYRIKLPVFEGGTVVSTKLYGRLPVQEIKRRASTLGLAYDPEGNMQAVFQLCNGGGSGSHTESATPGVDVGARVEQILTRIDQSKYTFLQ